MTSVMRSLALALVLVLTGGVSVGVATAQSPAGVAEASQVRAGSGSSEAPPPVVDTRPRRPSGFWTSTEPAKGGAYRYRLLGIACVILAITGGFMIWLVRRQSRRSA